MERRKKVIILIREDGRHNCLYAVKGYVWSFPGKGKDGNY